MKLETYKPIIGLEIHIEPNTKSKMFCRCPQDHFAKKPNTQTCPICLGLPGALPYTNKEGVLKTIRLGLALGTKISEYSKFYRKNYFYPDLPKGYQTSQLDSPLCMGGILLGKRINHIHLEEDAGKLVHETINGQKCSLIDFNRSGCALIEIVTEPDFHDTLSVINFVKEIQLIARYLDVSNADMEKGSMRLEANISLSSDGNLPNYKVEIKNINSFRFLEKAINAELARQESELKAGKNLIQETRGYDEVKQITYSQRTKAEAYDYRYFPEADLPPMKFSPEEINKLEGYLPELPEEKRIRFLKDYSLPKDFIEILVADLGRADYFEEAAKLNNNYKTIADLMINKKLDEEFPEPAGLIKKIMELTDVTYADDAQTQKAIDEVLSEEGKAVKDYASGKTNVLGFLIGAVQKKLGGKGNPKMLADNIIKQLEKNG